MIKNIILSACLISFFVTKSEQKEYTCYTLTTIQETLVKREVLKKSDEQSWVYELIECPANTEPLDAENSACQHRKDFASDEQIEKMKTLPALFPFLEQNFEDACPGLLQLMGKEDLTFLRNKYLFHDDQKEIFIMIMHTDGQACNFILRKATPEERRVYIKLTAIQYQILTNQIAQSKEQSMDNDMAKIEVKNQQS